MTPRGVERAIIKLLEERRPRTACPSEVARRIDAEQWRSWMPRVRDAAFRLARRGRLEVTQKGKQVEPDDARGPIRIRFKSLADEYRQVDFRRNPERYRIGRGEQGVLTVEPYKSELLPLWRFRTEADARASAKALWSAFVRYRNEGDFVGMDMARKFLQMGFTRARRYANHRSGRKYDERGAVAPLAPAEEKARAAAVFHQTWQKLEADRRYREARARWITTSPLLQRAAPLASAADD